ncbi:MAG: polyprenyl synthetase family protein [Actinomycetota bacterium]|nr:polyprenyl synthetase family protein [Actinomycetota bacterium]
MQLFTESPIQEIDQYLARLEVLLGQAVASDDPRLSEVAAHLIKAGGKRIRPTLTITSARAAGIEVDDRLLMAAVAVELVHLASLYHDDVMDEATTRRNVPSVNSRWGNLVAIVAGDFLLARAAAIAADLGQDVAKLLATTLAHLCEGQILEVNATFDSSRSVASYNEAIAGKTASLMATACRIGALSAGVASEQLDKLERIGFLFGMVYQIRDDVLDIIGTEEELGKLPGQDLIEGVYTLPTIIAIQSQGSNSEIALRLNEVAKNENDLTIAKKLIVGSGSIEESIRIAQEYCDEASRIAQEFGNAIGDYLGSLANSLLSTVSDIADERVRSA